MNTVAVSVIIPTYNKARSIRRCIESVLNQTHQPFEIMVVDDGSTDDTRTVMESYSKNPHIKYIKHETCKGAQAARNTGIKNASGDYIAFLDSDDEWLPDKLEIQLYKLTEVNRPCVVHGDAWVLREGQNEREVFNIPKLNGCVYKELLSSPGPLFQCILAPKYFFEKIGFLDEGVPSYQEWDTSIALSKHYEFVFCEEPLMVYYKYKEGTIFDNPLRGVEGYKYIVDKHKDEIISHAGKKALSRHYSVIGERYYNVKDLNQAKAHFFKAFVTSPMNIDNIGFMTRALLGAKVYAIATKSYHLLRRLLKNSEIPRYTRIKVATWIQVFVCILLTLIVST